MSKLNKTGAAGAICSVAVIIGTVLSNGEVKPAVPAWNLSATPRDAAVTRTNARLMYGRMVSATRTALNPVREKPISKSPWIGKEHRRLSGALSTMRPVTNYSRVPSTRR